MGGLLGQVLNRPTSKRIGDPAKSRTISARTNPGPPEAAHKRAHDARREIKRLERGGSQDIGQVAERRGKKLLETTRTAALNQPDLCLDSRRRSSLVGLGQPVDKEILGELEVGSFPQCARRPQGQPRLRIERRSLPDIELAAKRLRAGTQELLLRETEEVANE